MFHWELLGADVWEMLRIPRESARDDKLYFSGAAKVEAGQGKLFRFKANMFRGDCAVTKGTRTAAFLIANRLRLIENDSG